MTKKTKNNRRCNNRQWRRCAAGTKITLAPRFAAYPKMHCYEFFSQLKIAFTVSETDFGIYSFCNLATCKPRTATYACWIHWHWSVVPALHQILVHTKTSTSRFWFLLPLRLKIRKHILHLRVKSTGNKLYVYRNVLKSHLQGMRWHFKVK